MALLEWSCSRFDEVMVTSHNSDRSDSDRLDQDQNLDQQTADQPVVHRHPTVEDCLTVHGDLSGHEIETLVDHWAKLDGRLRSFDPGTVLLDLYLKDRERPSQHLTLEATIDRWPVLIATSSDQDLAHALNVVRDEMIRLITDARDRHHPRHRR